MCSRSPAPSLSIIIRRTVTFESDNEVIIYSLEKIISHARETQYIFLAQSIWWIASIFGNMEGLVTYIDNRQLRFEASQVPIQREATPKATNLGRWEVSAIPRDIQEDPRPRNKTNRFCSNTWSEASDTKDFNTNGQDNVLWDCEEFIKTSRQQQRIALKKTNDKTTSRCINPLMVSKRALRTKKEKSHKETEGISATEIESRKAEGDCLHGAWPSDTKGAHWVKDCWRPIKFNHGTASFAVRKQYQQHSSSESSD